MMPAIVTRLRDRIFGRGEYAITIPVFDGALKPNRALDEARVVATFDHPEDVAAGHDVLLIANGGRLERLDAGTAIRVADFDGPITALAYGTDGEIFVAVDGRRILRANSRHTEPAWREIDGIEARAINAIAVRDDGCLLVSDGSGSFDYADWRHDLMTRGSSGRLLLVSPGGGAKILASGLRYAFGVASVAQRNWVAETWAHRVVCVDDDGRREVIIDELPGYPCRMSPAGDGGCWLAVLAGRTQLIEFVLREPAFRRRMVAELDPDFWIAPALSSGLSFLEPLQGAGVKMRGVRKPWAPPRSYGLVIKLSAEGVPEFAFHSRLDGTHHGVVACTEFAGKLYALSKGSRRLLELDTRASRE